MDAAGLVQCRAPRGRLNRAGGAAPRRGARCARRGAGSCTQPRGCLLRRTCPPPPWPELRASRGGCRHPRRARASSFVGAATRVLGVPHDDRGGETRRGAGATNTARRAPRATDSSGALRRAAPLLVPQPRRAFPGRGAAALRPAARHARPRRATRSDERVAERAVPLRITSPQSLARQSWAPVSYISTPALGANRPSR